jgi:hypothetical protein
MAFFGLGSVSTPITLDAEYGIYPATLRHGHRDRGSKPATPLSSGDPRASAKKPLK